MHELLLKEIFHLHKFGGIPKHQVVVQEFLMEGVGRLICMGRGVKVVFLGYKIYKKKLIFFLNEGAHPDPWIHPCTQVGVGMAQTLSLHTGIFMT